MTKNKMNMIIVILGILITLGFVTNISKKDIKNKASESRYNDINPSDYHIEMKSDNLQYADIAWHAQNTYGWNCAEITDLGSKISTTGQEIKDPYLISQLKGYYQVATCSSGVKLRVYARSDSYPIITNINGGFE